MPNPSTDEQTSLCTTCTQHDNGCFIDPIGPVNSCTQYQDRAIDAVSREPVAPRPTYVGLLVNKLRAIASDNRTSAHDADIFRTTIFQLEHMQERITTLEKTLRARPGRL